ASPNRRRDPSAGHRPLWSCNNHRRPCASRSGRFCFERKPNRPIRRRRRLSGGFLDCSYFKLEWTSITNAKLEPATATVGRVARNRNAVIQAQRAQVRNIQAQTKSVVVVIY